MATLQVPVFPLYSECHPLFDLTENSLRVMCDFALMFSVSGLALVVGPNDEVAIAQVLPVVDLDKVFTELLEKSFGWKRDGQMLYSMEGGSGWASKAIKSAALDANANTDDECIEHNTEYDASANPNDKRPRIYDLTSGYLTSLNVMDYPVYGECHPLFDLTESSLRVMCDFTLLFATSGLALVVGLNNEVAIAQAVPVIDLDKVFTELTEKDTGWKRDGQMLYTMDGSSVMASDAIKAAALDINAEKQKLIKALEPSLTGLTAEEKEKLFAGASTAPMMRRIELMIQKGKITPPPTKLTIKQGLDFGPN